MGLLVWFWKKERKTWFVISFRLNFLSFEILILYLLS